MSKKRGHGEGTVKHLASGKWVSVLMDGRKSDGKPNWVRLYADTRRELTQVIEQYHQERRAGNLKAIPTFSAFSTSWWERYKRNLRPSTQSSYIYTLSKLQSYWDNTLLTQITASAIQDMLAQYEDIDKLSSSYITKLQGMMYQIMEAAEADDLIKRNPVRYIKHRTSNQQVVSTPPKDAFISNEIVAIWGASSSKIRDWALLAVMTGLRTQETLALCGNDISSDGSYITISKAVNMINGYPTIGPTKSVSSMRTIPVPTTVQYIAAKYHAYSDNLIWESPKIPGQPYAPSAYRKCFAKLCTEIEIRQLTPHCCRHTYVTLLRAHHVDSETVKVLVGHSQHGVTESYNHIRWETLVEAVDSLNDLVPDYIRPHIA